jgi:hypothetical protein
MLSFSGVFSKIHFSDNGTSVDGEIVHAHEDDPPESPFHFRPEHQNDEIRCASNKRF